MSELEKLKELLRQKRDLVKEIDKQVKKAFPIGSLPVCTRGRSCMVVEVVKHQSYGRIHIRSESGAEYGVSIRHLGAKI